VPMSTDSNNMAEYLSPGVYVEEFDSGAVPMQGVSTSTAGFLGLAQRGPVTGSPELVTNVADYRRMFGGYLNSAKYGEGRYLPYAIEQFFINGGSRAYVMRVVPADAKASSVKVGPLTISAANPGEWGDSLRVTLSNACKGRTQVMAQNGAELTLKNADGFAAGDVVEMFDGKTKKYSTITQVQDKVITLSSACDLSLADTKIGTEKYIRTCEFSMVVTLNDQMEEFNDLSLDPMQVNYVATRTAKSDLISVEVSAAKKAPAVKAEGKKDEAAPAAVECPAAAALLGCAAGAVTVALSGGSDGSASAVTAVDYIGQDGGPGERTGLQTFLETPDVSLLVAPGVVMPEVQGAMIAFCENAKSCFAILDMPGNMKKTKDLANFRDAYDTSYAAVYHPWLECVDGLTKRNGYFPPSGAMAGIYARSDTERGVHKAPANEVVRGCTGLSCPYNQAEQDILNPLGVNLIRAFTGRGIRVWGARTLSSNGLWKYINVRRLFIYIEQSIKNNTNWVVFEPNSEALWVRVSRTIEMFLASCWREGALMGSTPGEAFYVECSRATMTQDDIDNGRLICQIGIAPVKPAEFVIFRITQKTSSAE